MKFSIIAKLVIPSLLIVSCAAPQSSLRTSTAPSARSQDNAKGFFDPNTQSSASLVRLAKGFQQTGDMVNALNFYGQATVNDRSNIAAWYGLIRLLRDVNNFSGARTAIYEAKQYHPKNESLAILLAEVEIYQDNAPEALRVLSPYLNQQNPRILNLLGVASEMVGSNSLARSYYTKALTVTSNVTQIISNYALSYSFYNDHKTAISMLQRNLNDAQSRKEGYEILAIIYALDGQLDAALTISAEALSNEAAQENYSFFETLPKLNAPLRARAVFTRSIPHDALAYLDNSAQESKENTYLPVLEAPQENRNDLATQMILKSKLENSEPLVNEITKAEETTIKVDNPKPETKALPAEALSDDKSENITPQQSAVVNSPVIPEKDNGEPTLANPAESTVDNQAISQADAIPITTPPEEAVSEGHVAVQKTNVDDTQETISHIIDESEKDAEVITSQSDDSQGHDSLEPQEDQPIIEKADTEQISDNPLNIIADEKRATPEIEQKPTEEEPQNADISDEEIKERESHEAFTKKLDSTELPILDPVIAEAKNAYRVQIGSFSDILAAGKEWCRIYKRVASANIDEHPNVREIGVGDSRKFRLLIGEYEIREDADAVCSDLAGQKVSCYVVKGAGHLRPLESSCKTSDITE